MERLCGSIKPFLGWPCHFPTTCQSLDKAGDKSGDDKSGDDKSGAAPIRCCQRGMSKRSGNCGVSHDGIPNFSVSRIPESLRLEKPMKSQLCSLPTLSPAQSTECHLQAFLGHLQTSLGNSFQSLSTFSMQELQEFFLQVCFPANKCPEVTQVALSLLAELSLPTTCQSSDKSGDDKSGDDKSGDDKSGAAPIRCCQRRSGNCGVSHGGIPNFSVSRIPESLRLEKPMKSQLCSLPTLSPAQSTECHLQAFLGHLQTSLGNSFQSLSTFSMQELQEFFLQVCFPANKCPEVTQVALSLLAELSLPTTCQSSDKSGDDKSGDDKSGDDKSGSAPIRCCQRRSGNCGVSHGGIPNFSVSRIPESLRLEKPMESQLCSLPTLSPAQSTECHLQAFLGHFQTSLGSFFQSLSTFSMQELQELFLQVCFTANKCPEVTQVGF
ncbi:hypothetical protein HGM15179_017433 [Zosterops borbonicus]|uniref:Uncharacterized protein n=1 Tax=Zosterops borbonicus TaxID=364589 RepID=A0A8K1G0Y4_9PASS|nr:hypothetical protein HGM15179_017433 [Zosterops borbonicus]